MVALWRLTSLTLILCLLCALPARSEDGESHPYGGGVWSLSGEGVLRLEGVTRMSVSNHADVPWYGNMAGITAAEVCGGTTRLGHYAFSEADSLRQVTLEEGLETIGMSAFEGCASLTSIAFPDSLRSIDYWSFSRCTGLTELVIGSQLKEIANYAFQGCSGLEQVAVLEPIQRLGYDCLESCTRMNTLYLPATLTLIDQYALRDCPGLTDIYYAGTPEQWQKVEIAPNNETTLRKATIHYSVPYVPGATPPPSVESLKGGYIIKGIFTIRYDTADTFMFVRGLLDDHQEMMDLAHIDRSQLERYFEHNECIFYPSRFDDPDAMPYYCRIQAVNGWTASPGTLDDLIAAHDPEVERMNEQLADDLSALTRREDVTLAGLRFQAYDGYLGSDNAVYERFYVTLLNGSLVGFALNADAGSEAGGVAYLERCIDAIQPEAPQDAEPSPTPAPENGMQCYALMGGLLTLSLPEAEFDVLLADNSRNLVCLQRQGLTLDQANLYMKNLGCALKAIPAGQRLSDSDTDYTVSIRDQEYEDVPTLRAVDDARRAALADAVCASFSADGCTWYAADQVDYIVFDTQSSFAGLTLYSACCATIVDGRVYCLSCNHVNEPVTDAEKETLRRLVDAARWRL